MRRYYETLKECFQGLAADPFDKVRKETKSSVCGKLLSSAFKEFKRN
jgi:hypothetical protein